MLALAIRQSPRIKPRANISSNKRWSQNYKKTHWIIKVQDLTMLWWKTQEYNIDFKQTYDNIDRSELPLLGIPPKVINLCRKVTKSISERNVLRIIYGLVCINGLRRSRYNDEVYHIYKDVPVVTRIKTPTT